MESAKKYGEATSSFPSLIQVYPRIHRRILVEVQVKEYFGTVLDHGFMEVGGFVGGFRKAKQICLSHTRESSGSSRG